MPLRFVFGLHNHQPVGNFDSVFEQAYRDGYLPFLDLIERYPEIPITLHTSGPLMEWLRDHRPDYLRRLRHLVDRGQVEILGGAFYEPILSMLLRRDRVGQIRTYTAYLQELLGCKVRGMWLAERVWEPELAGDLAEAGIEFTLLDDYHFKQAGVDEDRLTGYYLTEDEGRLLKVFPISEPMRYLVPWKSPEESIEYFRHVASKNPDAVIVCADDGEKFGGWPETHKHCYTDGWLPRFFDLLRQHKHWVRYCTLAQAVDETPPVGTIYLPDCSYREMTEWSLPASRLQAYNRMVKSLEHDPRGGEIRGFLRGGFWRNFRVKYPELQEMYARMLEVSRRVEQCATTQSESLAEARTALYRGQCNCSYWHGAFGGLYLPHLRNAVYHHLIAAENAALKHQTKSGSWVEGEASDFNLDGKREVCLRNAELVAYFIPHHGGSLYELDLRRIRHNLLATLSRRPEAYHETILQAAGVTSGGEWKALHEQVKFKQPGLERLLHYDRYLRKSLIDHFYEPQVSLRDLTNLRETELGDFVSGPYSQQIEPIGASGARLTVTLQRQGQVAGAPVRLTKVVRLEADSDTLSIRYVVENLPRDRKLHFAVEFNFAGMAAGADDRYFYHAGQARAGQLQTQQDLKHATKIGLVDEWLGLDASLTLSRPGGIWAFPIQTVSQSEGGFELVHQSTAVLPHWLIEADANGRWEVTIDLRLDTSRAKAR